MSPGRTQLAIAALSTTLAIAAATAAATAARWEGVPAWSWVALAFFPVLTAGSSLFVRMQFRDQVLALDLFEAVLAPAVFVLPGPSLVAAVAAAVATSELMRRNSPVKAIFNVAQWSAAAATGSLVMAGAQTGSVSSRLVPLAAAMVAVTVINTVAFVGVVRLAQGVALAQVFVSSAPLIALNWAVTTPAGVLFAAAYSASPAMLAFVLLPLVLLHTSGRALAAARVDEARLEGLHRASLAMNSVSPPQLHSFLEVVRTCFEAEAAELILDEGGELAVHHVGADGSLRVRPVSPGELSQVLHSVAPVRLTAGRDALGPLVAASGYRDCLAAPFATETGRGAVAVFNRTGLEGFDSGEVSVLEALGREVGQALDRSALFERVISERAKLSRIVDQASDGIVTLAADGTVTSWNPGMAAITGHPADDALGGPTLSWLHPRDSRGVPVDFGRWRDLDVPAEVQIVAIDGAEKWLSCAYTRVDGDEPMLVIVARDATRAHELEQLRDDFVSTVSHELRTPLTPIRGFASTLLEHGDSLTPERREEALKLILRQAQRLEGLIVNLLEVTKIEGSQAAELPGSIVDLTEVAHEVVADFAETHADRTIELVTSQGFCGAHGNQVWVERILINLVSNALKYAPAGEPIEVRVGSEGGLSFVTVADRGPGIPPSAHERIFDRFERLSHTHIQPGTGLGLYLARRLAQTMDGTLIVESSPGEGSAFTLRLPAVARLVAVS